MIQLSCRLSLLALVFGCAEAPPLPGKTPAQPSAPHAASAEPARAPEEPAALPEPEPERVPTEIAMPTECAKAGAQVCSPPKEFVTELCKRSSTDLALAMFKKSTPWTRAYLRRDMEAWYAGARLATPAQLRLDEEVIVVADRSGGGNGIVVGGGSYDVIRWNGKCVSVMSDEVTLDKPPLADVAEISWRRLGDETRDALAANRRVKLAYELARDRCREDRTTARCNESTEALSLAIADYIRRGGDVPEPKLVMW